ncbi:MAG: hypothetical protein ACK5O7_06550 [Holosporales bacterium]
MFKKVFNWFLILNHFYIYNVYASFPLAEGEIIEVRKDEAKNQLTLAVSKQDKNQNITKQYSHSFNLTDQNGSTGFDLRGARFFDKTSPFELKAIENGKLLTLSYLEPSTHHKYSFHIDPQGNISTAVNGSLKGDRSLQIRTTGTFKLGNSLSANQLLVSAVSILIDKRLDCQQLSLFADRLTPEDDFLGAPAQQGSSSSTDLPSLQSKTSKARRDAPIFFGPSSHVRIGEALHVSSRTQPNGAAHPDQKFLEVQGYIGNLGPSKDFLIDLHGENLLVTSREGEVKNPGQISHVFSAGKLTVKNAGHVTNHAEIVADQLSMSALSVRNYLGASITAKSDLTLNLGAYDSFNGGLISGGRSVTINHRGQFVNSGRLVVNNNDFSMLNGTTGGPIGIYINGVRQDTHDAPTFICEKNDQIDENNKNQIESKTFIRVQGHSKFTNRGNIRGGNISLNSVDTIENDGNILAKLKFAVTNVKSVLNGSSTAAGLIKAAFFKGRRVNAFVNGKNSVISAFNFMLKNPLKQRQQILINEGLFMVRNWLELDVFSVKNLGTLEALGAMIWHGKFLRNVATLAAGNLTLGSALVDPKMKGKQKSLRGSVENEGVINAGRVIFHGLFHFNNQNEANVENAVSGRLIHWTSGRQSKVNVGRFDTLEVDTLINHGLMRSYDDSMIIAHRHFHNTNQIQNLAQFWILSGKTTLAPNSVLFGQNHLYLATYQLQNYGSMVSHRKLHVAIEKQDGYEDSFSNGCFSSKGDLRLFVDGNLLFMQKPVQAPEAQPPAAEANAGAAGEIKNYVEMHAKGNVTIAGAGQVSGDGKIHAQKDVLIAADLMTSGIISGTKVHVDGEAATKRELRVLDQGEILAKEELSVKDMALLENEGILQAQGEVGIEAEKLINAKKGVIESTTDRVELSIDAGQNLGMIEATDSILLRIRDKFDLAGSVVADEGIAIEGEENGRSKITLNGELEAKKGLAFKDIQKLDQSATATAAADENITLHNVANLMLAGKMQAGSNLTATGAMESITISKDAEVLAGDKLKMGVGAQKVAYIENHGFTTGLHAVEIGAKTFVNGETGSIQAGHVKKDQKLNPKTQKEESETRTAGEGKMLLAVDEGRNEGWITGGNYVQMNVKGLFTNKAKIHSHEESTVMGLSPDARLHNVGEEAELISNGRLVFQKAGDQSGLSVVTQDKSKLMAGTTIDFQSGAVLENGALTQAAHQIKLSQTHLQNVGALAALGDETSPAHGIVMPHLTHLDNAANGAIVSKSTVHMPSLTSFKSAGLLDQASDIKLGNLNELALSGGALLSANGGISIDHQAGVDSYAAILAPGKISLTGGVVHLHEPVISETGDVAVKASDFANFEKLSGVNVNISAPQGEIFNQGVIRAQETAFLEASRFALEKEQDGATDGEKRGVEAKTVHLKSGDRLYLSAAVVGVNPLQTLHLESSALNVMDALSFPINLTLTGPLYKNNAFIAQRDLTLDVPGDFHNSHDLLCGGDLRLKTSGSLVNGSLIHGHKLVDIDTDGNTDNHREISAKGELKINAKQNVINYKNTLLAAGTHLDVEVGDLLHNYVGTIRSAGTMRLKGNQLYNMWDGKYRVQLQVPHPKEQRHSIEFAYSQPHEIANITCQNNGYLDFNHIYSESGNIVSCAGNLTIRHGIFDLISNYLEDVNSGRTVRKCGHSERKETGNPKWVETWDHHIIRTPKDALLSAGKSIILNGVSYGSQHVPGFHSTGIIRANQGIQGHVDLIDVRGITPGAMPLARFEQPLLINLMKELRHVGEGYSLRYNADPKSSTVISSVLPVNMQSLLLNRALPSLSAGERLRWLDDQPGPRVARERFGHFSVLLRNVTRLGTHPFEFEGWTHVPVAYLTGRTGHTPHTVLNLSRDPVTGAFRHIVQYPVIGTEQLNEDLPILLSPIELSEVVVEALLKYIGATTLYGNITNPLQLVAALHASGLNLAGLAKGRQPVDYPALGVYLDRNQPRPDLLRLDAAVEEAVQEDGSLLSAELSRALAEEKVVVGSADDPEELRRKYQMLHPDMIHNSQDAFLFYEPVKIQEKRQLVPHLHVSKEGRNQFAQRRQVTLLAPEVNLEGLQILMSGAQVQAVNANLESKGDTSLEAVDVKVQNELNLKAGGNTWITGRHTAKGFIRSTLSGYELKAEAGGKIVHAGVDHDWWEAMIVGQDGVQFLGYQEVETHESHHKKGKRERVMLEQILRQMRDNLTLRGERSSLIDGGSGESILLGTNIQNRVPVTMRVRAGGVLDLLDAETIVYQQETKVTKHTTNTKVKTTRREDHYFQPMTATGGVVFDIAPGAQVDLKLHARKHTHLSQVLDRMAQDPATSWVAQLRGHPAVDFELLEEVHKHRSKTKRSLSPAASFVLSLAISLAVPGPGWAGSTWYTQALAAAGNTAVKGLVASAGVAVANNSLNGKLDLKGAWRQLASQDNICSLAINAVSAGVLGGAGILPPTGGDFLQSLKYAAAQNAVGTTLNVALQRTELKDALRSLPLNIATQTLAMYGAGLIGEARAEFVTDQMGGEVAAGAEGGEGSSSSSSTSTSSKSVLPPLDAVSHKVAHGLLAGSIQALRGGNQEAILTAAGAAMAAEAMAELLQGDPRDFMKRKAEEAAAEGRQLTQEEFAEAWQERLQESANIAKFASASTALFFRQDPAVAFEAADNAIDHNLVPAVIMIGMAAWSAYDILQAYREGGPEAALKQAGYEGFLLASGACAGKLAFKIGAKTIVGAEAAWVALCGEYPVLNKLAQKLAPYVEKALAAAEELSAKGEKLAAEAVESALKTDMGQAVAKAATQFEAKAIAVGEKVVESAAKSELGQAVIKAAAKVEAAAAQVTAAGEAKLAKLTGGNGTKASARSSAKGKEKATDDGGFSSSRGVWEQGPAVRGEIIEKKLGQNLHQNFPVIDKFTDGTVTSIKSLDLMAPTYLNAGKLERTLKGYVNKVAKFEGGELATRVITPDMIQKRALELAVPFKGNSVQQSVLKKMESYAESQGVVLKVIITK